MKPSTHRDVSKFPEEQDIYFSKVKCNLLLRKALLKLCIECLITEAEDASKWWAFLTMGILNSILHIFCCSIL